MMKLSTVMVGTMREPVTPRSITRFLSVSGIPSAAATPAFTAA